MYYIYYNGGVECNCQNHNIIAWYSRENHIINVFSEMGWVLKRYNYNTYNIVIILLLRKYTKAEDNIR